MFINNMNTVNEKSLHYIQCYALLFPDAGAAEVAAELLGVITGGVIQWVGNRCPECHQLWVYSLPENPLENYCVVCDHPR